jgi:hypothetical protein
MTYKSDSVKKPVPLRLTEDLRDRVREKAKNESRSFNGTVEYALKFYLRVTEKK